MKGVRDEPYKRREAETVKGVAGKAGNEAGAVKVSADR